MINLGLFFNRTLNIGDIYFTGHESEEAVFSTTVTDNPVEYGANTVDNIFINPILLTFNAFVSELPAYTFTPQGLFNAFKETSDAIDVLYQLMVSRQVVDVKCNIGFFPGMAITEIRPISNNDNLTTIPMQISLKQIVFTNDPSYQDPFQSKYKDMVNRGALELAEFLAGLIV
jgi:hypothetical protein